MANTNNVGGSTSSIPIEPLTHILAPFLLNPFKMESKMEIEPSDGRIDVKRLDKWIRQIEHFFC